MEVDIKKDENEPELTYPYEEMDPLNPSSPASESNPEDVIKVENPIEHEDETVLASVYEAGESSTAPFLREESDGLFPGKVKDEFYGKLILDLGNEVRSSVEQGTATMENLGFVFEERPKKLSMFQIMPPKSAPLTQSAIRRMIKDNVDAVIAAERARQENVRNDASGSGQARGHDFAPTARECTFARFIKCNPTAFCGTCSS
nr:hypothetical protein [Tanacetum cinerariifolium]